VSGGDADAGFYGEFFSIKRMTALLIQRG